MKNVTAREANQDLSKLDAERQAKVERAMELTRKGLPWPDDILIPPTRDEMHER